MILPKLSFFAYKAKLLIALLAAFAYTTAFAEAPDTQVSGTLLNNIELRGAVLNAGASIGNTSNSGLEMEVSVGTIHEGATVNAVTNNILIYGLLGGVSITNASLAWQGSVCSKVSIGSVGASSCSDEDDL